VRNPKGERTRLDPGLGLHGGTGYRNQDVPEKGLTGPFLFSTFREAKDE
jgi:hypothetical protein